ncbi:thioredoxin family protein [Leptospira semungkisensis]|uniref:Thioredoxin family protein n=1 Tax=Leptospira semungkisensis TaxID=2484985 RepID=A0A4R9G8N4_9LEPT|nr:thioredoxin family protein [Leptospira semungkisensis]TGK07410.1 thioredoxin family protein [Leptospira semungkisensis]
MIEFQYFDGCPNSEATLNNLKNLIKENIIDIREVKIVEVKNPEEADKLNFQGSPTILINGIDIYTGMVPETSNFSCRSYVFEGERTGVISEEYIKYKYEQYKVK